MEHSITVRVDELTKKALQIEARQKGFTLSVYVRRILIGLDRPTKARRRRE